LSILDRELALARPLSAPDRELATRRILLSILDRESALRKTFICSGKGVSQSEDLVVYSGQGIGPSQELYRLWAEKQEKASRLHPFMRPI
jgi:hypothetical protein